MKQSWQHLVAGTAVFLISLSVYIATMPTGLTWAHFGVDGGELITASYTLGVAHPPGYPLYIILGKLFSYLPVGSIAYRYTLFSATCTAISAGFLAVLISQQATKDNLIWGIFAGLTFAFGTLVWQQAIIVEVYGLFLALLAATVWASETGKPAWLIGLFFGLSVTGHVTAVFTLPFLLFNFKQDKWLTFSFGTLLGLIPFLWLPLLALGNSPVVWGDPTTISGWFQLITASIYQENPFNFSAFNISERLISFGGRWLTHYTIAGIFLIALGIWYPSKARQRQGVYLLTAVIYLLFSFAYGTGDAIVLSLPAFLFLILILIDGSKVLGRWVLVLPLALILLNFATVNIRQDRLVHQQLEQIVVEVPQNALIETSGEAILFSLWYMKFVTHQREDVLIVDNQLYAYSWYRERLKQQDDSLTHLNEDIGLLREQVQAKRPFCTLATPKAEEVLPTILINCAPTTQH